MKFASDNGVLGAGVDYTLASHWTLRLEYQRYLELGGNAFPNEAEVDSVSLGVQFRR